MHKHAERTHTYASLTRVCYVRVYMCALLVMHNMYETTAHAVYTSVQRTQHHPLTVSSHTQHWHRTRSIIDIIIASRATDACNDAHSQLARTHTRTQSRAHRSKQHDRTACARAENCLRASVVCLLRTAGGVHKALLISPSRQRGDSPMREINVVRVGTSRAA